LEKTNRELPATISRKISFLLFVVGAAAARSGLLQARLVLLLCGDVSDYVVPGAPPL